MLEVPRSYIKSIAIEVDNNYSLANAPFPSHDSFEKESSWLRLNNFTKKIVRPLIAFSGKIRAKLFHPDDKRCSAINQAADDERSSGFIGRVQLIGKFVKFLQSENSKGVFLVTGYRGMGKTSFVNQALDQYKRSKTSEDSKSMSIHLTLAQSNPREIDILRLMVISVYDKFKVYLKDGNKNCLKIYRSLLYILHLLLVLFIIFAIPLIVQIWETKDSCSVGNCFSPTAWSDFTEYPCIVKIMFLFYALSFGFLKGTIYFLEHMDSPYNRITWLVERCNAALAEEVSSSGSGIPAFSFKLFNDEKKTKQYAIVNTKEIEYELQQFLEKAKEKYHLDFIFVFDELDKVDPEIVRATDDYYFGTKEKKPNDRAYENDIKYRREAIINIIAGLKNFFTTADARFIFIAGREMFDASLADIADRQSAISSIFTFVFYIESLLKEKSDANINDPSLSTAIEQYVQYLLFGNSGGQRLFERLRGFQTYDKETASPKKMPPDERGKLYFTVQNFVTYLTYRSNGSPKKLIKEIHEFIILEDKVKQLKRDQQGQDIFYENPAPKKNSEKRMYLYFNYYNQYRIGFINYLYRPFLIKYGRSFKLYDDNVIVSTPYLFDHLLKFHPFAFSMANLELLPELMSSNKTPSVRLHIRQIIEHLGANHIREIEIGLFDYKFYSRTLNEITFLSRVFATEAAALNYTLDESFHIKNLVIDKIKELRSDHSNSWKNKNQFRQIFSIAHLNGILGDLHFFDQEYDDAIVAYSDAIRTISLEKPTELSLQDFVVLIRIKLKIGLCFEKVNAYDDALAQFADCTLDITRLMNYRLNKGIAIKIEREDEVASDASTAINSGDNSQPKQINSKMKASYYDTAIYRSATLSDFLQIILQAYLSQMFIQEKKSVAGISEYKLFTTLGSFFKITEGFKLFEYRNHIIKANALLHAGNLIYFKNSDRPIQIDDPKIKQAYSQNLPDQLRLNLEKLIRTYDEKFKDGQKQRKPTLALYLYVMGMAESLNYGHQTPHAQQNGKTTKSGNEAVEPDIFIRDVSEKGNIVLFLLDYLKAENIQKEKSFRAIYYNYTASFLSSIGDCLFGMYENRNEVPKSISMDIYLYDKPVNAYAFKLAPQKGIIREKNIVDFFDLTKLTKKNIENEKMLFDEFLNPQNPNDYNFSDVLRCYYLAGRYYLKEGRIFSCSFQFRKILYVLRLILDNEKDPGLSELFCGMLRSKIIAPLLELTSRDAFNTDNHGFNKARRKIGSRQRGYIVNNLSNHPETREIILAYNYIKLKIGWGSQDLTKLISPENSFATQQARLLELDFYAKYLEDKPWDEKEFIHSTRFSNLKMNKDADGSAKENSNDEIKAHSTRETINGTAYLYSMLSILQILDIYGSDYWLGYSYFAYIHFRVAQYISKLKIRSVKIIENQLKLLLGEGSTASLDKYYHYSKAKKLYEDAIQLHTAGNSYKAMIEDMIYLEDDFNDTAYHFGAAIDRYLITNQVFSEKIEACDRQIRMSPFLKEELYFF